VITNYYLKLIIQPLKQNKKTPPFPKPAKDDITSLSKTTRDENTPLMNNHKG